MKSKPEDVESHQLNDLDEDTWEALFNWIDKYQEKYPLIGRMVGWVPGVTYDYINEKSGFSLKPVTGYPEPRMKKIKKQEAPEEAAASRAAMEEATAALPTQPD